MVFRFTIVSWQDSGPPGWLAISPSGTRLILPADRLAHPVNHLRCGQQVQVETASGHEPTVPEQVTQFYIG